MRPEELRIGNLIYWDIPQKKGVPHKVVGIFESGNIHTQPISLDDLNGDKYKPIPLTEEWLEKFGFGASMALGEFNSGERQMSNKDVSVIIETKKGVLVRFGLVTERDPSLNMPVVDFVKVYNCKHVHQFQNLYYALTGKELAHCKNSAKS